MKKVLYGILALILIVLVGYYGLRWYLGGGKPPYQDGYSQGFPAGRQDYVSHKARETEELAKEEVESSGERDPQFIEGYWEGYQVGYPSK